MSAIHGCDVSFCVDVQWGQRRYLTEFFSYRINVRRNNSTQTWHVTKVDEQHNHEPAPAFVKAYKDRMHLLTDEMRSDIVALADVGIKPEDILACLRRKYADWPLITAQDVKNIRPPTGGGSTDAYCLLQKLLSLQAEDSRWFVRFQVNPATNKLTHIFWMSPRQRQMATDLYQVLIHDNTYKTNRFKLPCGLFSAPNRHGQTVLLAMALTDKEGTGDYEWQYSMFQEAAGISPALVLIDVPQAPHV